MTQMSCLSTSEIWKPIPGYEGIYEASSQGRIRSVDGKITSCKKRPVVVWKQRVLKPKVEKRKGGKTDQRVCLWKDGIEKTWLVARLVAMAFIPIQYEEMTVNHINGDPMDNRIENLEWLTKADNIRHGFDTGLYKASEKAVILTDASNGSKLRFKSMAAASRNLGRRNQYVSDAISRGTSCYDLSGKKYYASLAKEDDEDD